ncbi:hypothetical protein KVM60_02510 [Helicobacter pylori]|nr:hypothetical protein KVM60_02510 [Helicobacter pylori]
MQFPLKKDLKISQKYVIPKGFDPTNKEYKNLLVKDLSKSVYISLGKDYDKEKESFSKKLQQCFKEILESKGI